MVWIILCILLAFASADETGYLITASGDGYPQYPYSDTPPRYTQPKGIALDSVNGYLWITDTNHHNIRRLSKDGTAITIGTGPGPVGIDGVGAQNVRFQSPAGIAIHPSTGIIYIAQLNHVIRCLDPSNFNVSTIAGSAGVTGSTDGTGTQAKFNTPLGIVVDNTTNTLYIADSANNAIRAINLDTWVVSTVVGISHTASFVNGPAASATLNSPRDVAVDWSGNLYISDYTNNAIRLLAGGTVSTYAGGSYGNQNGTGTAAKLSFPSLLTFDGKNTLYFLDAGRYFKKIDLTTVFVTTIFSSGCCNSIDGPLTSAYANQPNDIAVDPVSDYLFIADTFNGRIRTYFTKPPPAVTYLAATQITATTIYLNWLPPTFMFSISNFTLEFDNGNGGTSYQLLYNGSAISYKAIGLTSGVDYRFRITPMNQMGTGPVSSVLVASTTAAGVPLPPTKPSPPDTVNYVTTTTIPLSWVAGDNNGANITSYRLEFMLGPNQNGSWATFYNGNASSVLVTGLKPMSPYMFRVFATNTFGEGSPSETLYISTAGFTCSLPVNANPSLGSNFANDFVYDPKTRTLWFAESNRVRQIDFFGNIYATYGSGAIGSLDGPGIYARMNYPYGLAIDANGTVYFTERANCIIRKIQNGVVTTIAGTALSCSSVDGNRTTARFNQLQPITIGGDGFIYAMENPFILRKVNPVTGDVTTAAGSSACTCDADGYGTYATFGNSMGIETDIDGNILVSSQTSSVIRKYDIVTREVITIAGNSSYNQIARKDGFRKSAIMAYPIGMSLDASTGSIYYMDTQTYTVRRLDTEGHVTTIAGGHSGGSSDGEGLINAYFGISYYITAAQPGFVYFYDNNAASLKLLYGAAPPAPLAPQIVALGSTSVSLSWYPTIAYCGIANYTLQVDDGTGFYTIYNGTNSNFTLAPLTPGTTGVYRVKVMATNRFGSSPWSDIFSFDTPSAGPPTKSPEPKVTSGWAFYSVNISWAPAYDNGSPITSYTLLRDDGKGGAMSVVYTGLALTYYNGSLSPLTLYRFQMYCSNALGDSPLSPVLEWSTTAPVENTILPNLPLNGQVSGIAFDKYNNLWIANGFNYACTVSRISPDGKNYSIGGNCASVDGNDTVARFSNIYDIEYDSKTDTILVADFLVGLRRITYLPGTGRYNVTTVFPAAGAQLVAISADDNGTIYVGDNIYPPRVSKWKDGVYTPNFVGGDIYREANDYGQYAGLYSPQGLAIDPSKKNLYIACSTTDVVKVARLNDTYTSIIGGTNFRPGNVDGLGPVALFDQPHQMTIDPTGRILYFSDYYTVRMIALQTGRVQTMVSSTISKTLSGASPYIYYPRSIKFDPYGFLWFTSAWLGNIYVLNCITSLPVPVKPLAPTFSNPGNNTVYVTLKAGSLHAVTTWELWISNGTGYQLFYSGPNTTLFIPSYNPDQNVTLGLIPFVTYAFYACAKNIYGGLCGNSSYYTSSALSVPISSSFITPSAVTYFNGFAYVTSNNAIYQVEPTSGNTTAFATGLNNPTGITVNPNTSTLFVADTNNCVIRSIPIATGVVSTYAGIVGTCSYVDGDLSVATFNYPKGVAYDPSNGNIVVADTLNHAIRVINQSSISVLTIGGNGTAGISDGDSSVTMYNSPVGLVVSNDGTIYVSDTGNNVIRTIIGDPVSATFSGTPGPGGYADGQSALFSSPQYIDIDAANNILYIADKGNQLVRRIPLSGPLAGFAATAAGTPGVPGNVDAFSGTQYNNPTGIAFDTVTKNLIVVDSGNSALKYLYTFTAVAGPSRDVCISDSVFMQAVKPTVGLGTWAIKSGPGVVTELNNPNSPVTGLSTTVPTTFLWTTHYNFISSQDTVTITTIRLPVSTIVSSTPTPLCNSSIATLTAAITSPDIGTWVILSGSGTITTPNNPSTTVTGISRPTLIAWDVMNSACPTVESTVMLNYVGPDVTAAASILDYNLTGCGTTALLTANEPTNGGIAAWSATPAGPTFTLVGGTTWQVTGLIPNVTNTLTYTIYQAGCQPLLQTFSSVVITPLKIDYCGVCGGSNNCVQCNVTDGPCCMAPWFFVPAGTPCRNSSSACDAVDYCTGSSSVCIDKVENSTVMCRGSTSVCDAPDYCDGTTLNCPDTFASPSVVCRNSSGSCDVAETCTGASVDCPPDGFAPPTQACNVSGACDASGFCSGSGPTCPAKCVCPFGSYGVHCEYSCPCALSSLRFDEADGLPALCSCALSGLEGSCGSASTPSVSSAQFAPDGLSIVVRFNVDTDQARVSGSTDPCSIILSDSRVKLGSAPVCYFASPVEFIIRFGSDATITIGDSITLVSGTVAGLNHASALLAHTVIALNTSSSPTFSVKVQGPTTAPRCGSINLVGIHVGGGGRALVSSSWVLVAVDSVSMATPVGTHLELFTSLVSLSAAGSIFTFNLTVRNFLGLYASTVHQVIVYDEQPVAAIVAPPAASLLLDSVTYFRGAPIVSSCATEVPVTYKWTLGSSNGLDEVLNAHSVRNDLQQLVLPPYTLRAATQYALTFSVSANSHTSYSNYSFFVPSQPLVAFIVGGDRLVPNGKAITFDASSSYDPDALPGTPMSYLWSCVNFVTNTSCYTSPTLPTSSTFSPTWGTSYINSTLLVTVTVTSGPRQASSTVKITVGDSSTPQFQIASPYNVIASDKVTLLGTSDITPATSQFMSWCATDRHVDTSDRSLFLSDKTNPNLVVKPNVLFPGKHTMRLEGKSLTTDKSGFAEVSLSVLQPPAGGSFAVEPASGFVHTTSFYLYCEGWEAEDNTSVYYSFYFAYERSTKEYSLGNKQLSPVKRVYLTPGIIDSGKITIIAYIESQKGATVRQTVQVDLQNPVLPATNPSLHLLSTAVDSLRTNFTYYHDVDATLQQINMLVNLLLFTNFSNSGDLSLQEAQIKLQLNLIQLFFDVIPYIVNTDLMVKEQTDTLALLTQQITWVNDTLTSNVINYLDYIVDKHSTPDARENELTILAHIMTPYPPYHHSPNTTYTSLLDRDTAMQGEKVLDGISIAALADSVCGEDSSIITAGEYSIYVANDYLNSIAGHQYNTVMDEASILFPNATFGASTLSCLGVQIMEQPLLFFLYKPRNISFGSDVSTFTLRNGSQVYKLSGLQTPLTITIPLDVASPCNKSNNCNRTCVYWNYNSELWDPTGCTTTALSSSTVCKCNHLSDFAVQFMDTTDVFKDKFDALRDPSNLNDAQPGPTTIVVVTMVAFIASIITVYKLDARKDAQATNDSVELANIQNDNRRTLTLRRSTMPPTMSMQGLNATIMAAESSASVSSTQRDDTLSQDNGKGTEVREKKSVGLMMRQVWPFFVDNMKKQHRWFGIHNAVNYDSYDRARMLTVMWTAIMGHMMVSAIFYAYKSRNNHTDVYRTISIGIYSSLITFPFLLLISQLFKRSDYFPKLKHSLKTHGTLPWWTAMLAYLIAIGFCIVSMFVTILSSREPQFSNGGWVLALLWSILQDIFLNETVSQLFFAFKMSFQVVFILPLPVPGMNNI